VAGLRHRDQPPDGRHDAPVPRAPVPHGGPARRVDRPLPLTRGRPKYYRATDNLRSESYRGLLPEDLADILTINSLHYSHNSESGVLFHLIGALSQFGKLGMTAIGNSREEVEALYEKTLRILDARPRSGV